LPTVILEILTKGSQTVVTLARRRPLHLLRIELTKAE
jgi:hypothetical protein